MLAVAMLIAMLASPFPVQSDTVPAVTSAFGSTATIVKTDISGGGIHIKGVTSTGEGAGAVATPVLIRISNQVKTQTYVDIEAQQYSGKDGTFDLTLSKAGNYDVSIYKGPEYENFIFQVSVAADQTADISINLKRIYNMPAQGWYSGDTHSHTTYSDGHNTTAEMAQADVALGLNFAVLTDHNSVSGNSEFISAGQEYSNKPDAFLPIAGDEVTTHGTPAGNMTGAGHFNVWEPNSSIDLNPTVNLSAADGRTTDASLVYSLNAIADNMKTNGALSVINHPNADLAVSALGAPGGMSFVRTDIDWTQSDVKDLISKFDATEIWNGGNGFMTNYSTQAGSIYTMDADVSDPATSRYIDIVEGKHITFLNWYKLLNTGVKFPSLGSSDCHDRYAAGTISNYNAIMNAIKSATGGSLPDWDVQEFITNMGPALSSAPYNLSAQSIAEAGILYTVRNAAETAAENYALLPGAPRNYVYLGTDPLTAANVEEAVKAGKSFITNGPLINAKLNGKIPGETSNISKNATISITVDSVRSFDTVKIIADGYTVKTIDLPDSTTTYTNDALSLESELSGKKWVLVYVEGSDNYQYAYTNPIYLDNTVLTFDKVNGFNNGNSTLDMSLIGRYSTGTTNADGGVAEIVKYNKANEKFYLVNGSTGKLDIVSLSSLAANQTEASNLAADASIDVAAAINGYAGFAGFVYGDLTSVDIDSDRGLVAVAVQAAGLNDDGVVAVFDTEGVLKKVVSAGKQPDCLVFTPDYKYILTANEGEPRDGYDTGTVDPAGSVTIVDVSSSNIADASAQTIGFESFDTPEDKQLLLDSKVLLKSGTLPSVDLEPEYLSISPDSRYAYVSLQEANAIARFDISTKSFSWIKGLGFKDYATSGSGIDIYRDGNINIKNETGFKGVYMPDGISVYEAGGKTYILTANEGDAREWGSYSDITSLQLAGSGQDGGTGKIKVDTLKTSDFENVFESNVKYLFGGRSFSIRDAEDMSLVYDSGSDFENYTAQYLPDRFNYSNDDTLKDKRSAKKGPESEDVKVGTIDGIPYAFIGMERIGGVFAYNLTDPAAPLFANYINSRDFETTVATGINGGDVSPEGQCFVSADGSPTGKPLLLAANEVSGTVSVFELAGASLSTEKIITIFHTNDMHGSLIDVKTADGSKDVIGAIATLKANTANSILVDAGDATQGNAVATLTKGEDIIKLMNAAGYAAMAAGNHEFDYGQEQLLSNAANASFPILSANAVKNGQPFLSGSTYANGTKTNNGANTIVIVDGIKVGFFGLTTPETTTKTNPAGIAGITFGNSESLKTTIENQVQTLRAEGAAIVVGLAHLGVDPSSEENRSTAIAEALGSSAFKPDILIDGHSHTAAYDQTINGIRIVQAGNSNNNLGMLQLTVNKTTGILSAVNETFIKQADLLKNAQAPAVNTIANGIRATYSSLLSPVVCNTEGPLWGGTVNGINEARLYETNLGNLVADSMAAAVKAKLPGTAYENSPVIVLQNGGGVRASITNGIITKGDVLNVLPYGNTISYKEITPSLLYEALENGVSKIQSQDQTTGKITGVDGRFPQVSGIRYEFDPGKTATAIDSSGNPIPGQVGSRITKIVLLNSDGSDKQVLSRTDSSTKMVFVFTDFGFTGGDGYTMLKNLPSIGEDVTQDTALENYLKTLTNNGTISLPYSYSQIKGRIKTTGTYSPANYTAAVTVCDLTGIVQPGKSITFKVDNVTRTGTTNAEGKLNITGLPDGPHNIKIADAADVLVNNYSGAGISTAVTVKASFTPSYLVTSSAITADGLGRKAAISVNRNGALALTTPTLIIVMNIYGGGQAISTLSLDDPDSDATELSFNSSITGITIYLMDGIPTYNSAAFTGAKAVPLTVTP